MAVRCTCVSERSAFYDQRGTAGWSDNECLQGAPKERTKTQTHSSASFFFLHFFFAPLSLVWFSCRGTEYRNDFSLRRGRPAPSERSHPSPFCFSRSFFFFSSRPAVRRMSGFWQSERGLTTPGCLRHFANGFHLVMPFIIADRR